MFETYPSKKHHKQFGSDSLGSLPADSREVKTAACGGAKGGGSSKTESYPAKAAGAGFKTGLPS